MPTVTAAAIRELRNTAEVLQGELREAELWDACSLAEELASTLRTAYSVALAEEASGV